MGRTTVPGLHVDLTQLELAMNKKIGIVALALAALPLAACGGGSNMANTAQAGAMGSPAAGMASPTGSMGADMGNGTAGANDMGNNNMDNGMASPSASGMDGGMNGGMNGGMDGGMQSKVVQMTAKEMPSMTMLPRGTTLAKAEAAGMGMDGNQVVKVTATDTGCIPAKTSVHAGRVWFEVTNKGMMPTKMFLERTTGKELIVVQNVQPNASGAFRALVKKGKYLLACQPGMGNTQIRTPLTVTAAPMTNNMGNGNMNGNMGNGNMNGNMGNGNMGNGNMNNGMTNNGGMGGGMG